MGAVLWAALLLLSVSGTLASGPQSLKSRRTLFSRDSQGNGSLSTLDSDRFSECILLFGAFCNGNMGDVIQASTMSRLVTSITSSKTCIWHAHPSKEDKANGFREGEFFANNSRGILHLGCDRASGEKVSRFKGFIIGGGGLFESRHWPLDCEDFVLGLGNELPVAIFGVGASDEASWSASIIGRADYVSGRDNKSARALSELLARLKRPRVKPSEVSRVRDPVLSDKYFRDEDGLCWDRDAGKATEKPLCFVLPSAMTEELQALHAVFSSQVVHEGDVLLNVFPKHQAEIEAYPYSAQIQPVLAPRNFSSILCNCRAVVASRLHGTVIALQAGVPTIAAWPVAAGNKVSDIMTEVLRFPDQFALVKGSMTRQLLLERVKNIDRAYTREQRRKVLFEKLDFISQHTRDEASRMLGNVFHLEVQTDPQISGTSPGANFWREQVETIPTLDVVEKEVKLAAGLIAKARLKSNSPLTGPVGVSAESDRSRGYGVNSATGLWNRWRKPWEGSGGTADEGYAAFAGSLAFAIATLMLIAVLSFPGISSLSKITPGASAFVDVPVSGKNIVCLSQDLLAKSKPIFALTNGRGARVVTWAFFGLNYIMWILLSMGYTVCSRIYLRETGNPLALLATQGWIGIGTLCTINICAGYRRRRAYTRLYTTSPALDEATTPTPSWLGKCGLKHARRAARNVWYAGFMHSGNAVLTSWSVLVGGVTVTHALKALEPVVAAGFSRCLLGSTLPPGRAAAVSIIVLGLGILTAPGQLPAWPRETGNSDNEDLAPKNVGPELALSALITACACCAVALRNVLLKKPDPPPPPPPLGLLVCCLVGALLGTAALLVPWLPCSWEWAGESLLKVSGVNAALCFVGYNLASFNLLAELSPVGHAVGNASKRVCLFLTGLLFLGEDKALAPKQLAGSMLAFVGLACYNVASTF